MNYTTQKTPVSFDLETEQFGPANQAPKIVCLTTADRGGNKVIHVSDDIELWLNINLDQAISGNIVLVGQHVAYDFACVLSNYPKLWEKVFTAYNVDGVTCTANRERLLDIAMGEFKWPTDNKGFKQASTYGMADIAKIRLGIDVAKGEDTWRTRYGELLGVPLVDWSPEAKSYAIGDAVITLDMFENQERRAYGMKYTIPTQFMDTRADLSLELMSAWGVTTNLERTKALWDSLVGRMQELAKTLSTTPLAGPKKATPAPLPGLLELPAIKQNKKATQEAIAQHYPGKVPTTAPTKKYPDGQIKTGEKVIVKCDYEPLKMMVEFKKLQKQCTTYLDKMFTGLIHARFDSVGTGTDRTACAEPTNLQNQPKSGGVRECYEPRPGYVYVSCDFDAQEMRTLAQCALDITGRSKLAERFQADPKFDPHLEFAANLGGVGLQDAVRLYFEKNKPMKDLRQQAKVANFGFPGGMSAKTLVPYAASWGIHLTLERAEQLKAAWFMQWPEMDPYLKHIKLVTGDAGSGIQTYPRSGFRRADVNYTNCANGYFQGLAAHASKRSLWMLTLKCYLDRNSALYGSRPVLFIHDENILEVPVFAVHEAALEMEQTMIEAMEVWTPDVPSAASATAMTRWSKDAERVMENGRLVAWSEEKP